MLLCGGNFDPTVYFSVNTQTMQAFWGGLQPNPVTVLDIDSASGGQGDAFGPLKDGFGLAKTAVLANGGVNALLQAYHGTLVPPFCTAAARGFFSTF